MHYTSADNTMHIGLIFKRVYMSHRVVSTEEHSKAIPSIVRASYAEILAPSHLFQSMQRKELGLVLLLSR